MTDLSKIIDDTVKNSYRCDLPSIIKENVRYSPNPEYAVIAIEDDDSIGGFVADMIEHDKSFRADDCFIEKSKELLREKAVFVEMLRLKFAEDTVYINVLNKDIPVNIEIFNDKYDRTDYESIAYGIKLTKKNGLFHIEYYGHDLRFDKLETGNIEPLNDEQKIPMFSSKNPLIEVVIENMHDNLICKKLISYCSNCDMYFDDSELLKCSYCSKELEKTAITEPLVNNHNINYWMLYNEKNTYANALIRLLEAQVKNNYEDIENSLNEIQKLHDEKIIDLPDLNYINNLFNNKEENTGEDDYDNFKMINHLNMAAFELENAGIINQAIELYEMNLKLKVKLCEPYKNLTRLYHKLSDFDNEIRIINEVLKLDIENKDYFLEILKDAKDEKYSQIINGGIKETVTDITDENIELPNLKELDGVQFARRLYNPFKDKIEYMAIEISNKLNENQKHPPYIRQITYNHINNTSVSNDFIHPLRFRHENRELEELIFDSMKDYELLTHLKEILDEYITYADRIDLKKLLKDLKSDNNENYAHILNKNNIKHPKIDEIADNIKELFNMNLNINITSPLTPEDFLDKNPAEIEDKRLYIEYLKNTDFNESNKHHQKALKLQHITKNDIDKLTRKELIAILEKYDLESKGSEKQLRKRILENKKYYVITEKGKEYLTENIHYTYKLPIPFTLNDYITLCNKNPQYTPKQILYAVTLEDWILIDQNEINIGGEDLLEDITLLNQENKIRVITNCPQMDVRIIKRLLENSIPKQ